MDMQSISIQQPSREHIAAIPGIEVAAASMFPEADLPFYLRHRATDIADLRDADEKDRLWVAVTVNGKAVGFASADVIDNQAYLEELDVLPEFGRLGIGTRLLLTVVNWARRTGYSSLLLVTFRHLPWNAPFYEKLGFKTLDPAKYGADIVSRLQEEDRAGINIRNRVAMQLIL